MGVTQHISQEDGGEQGDPLMPMLFVLGQHGSLVAIQQKLRDNEHVLAYHDDVYTVCKPARIADVQGLSMKSSCPTRTSSCITGRRKWNRGELEPTGIGALTRAARAVKPDAVVWRGDPLLPVHKQGLKILGIPIGQPAFVADFLERKSREQQALFQRIPWENDPQAAYLLLLMCASSRANFWLRCDQNKRSTLLPVTMTMFGHVCSNRAVRVRVAAHWSSWADFSRMI